MRADLVALRAAPLLAAFLLPRPSVGQDPLEEPSLVYEREVFYYEQAGRVDPFRSLLDDAAVGIRLEDLTLRGIVYHADPARSVAVLAQAGRERRIQARVGERFGSLRILAIYADRVELVIEELGVARRETLRIEKKPPEEGAR